MVLIRGNSIEDVKRVFIEEYSSKEFEFLTLKDIEKIDNQYLFLFSK